MRDSHPLFNRQRDYWTAYRSITKRLPTSTRLANLAVSLGAGFFFATGATVLGWILGRLTHPLIGLVVGLVIACLMAEQALLTYLRENMKAASRASATNQLSAA